MTVLVRDVRPDEYESTGVLLADAYAGASEEYRAELRDVGSRASTSGTEVLVAVSQTGDKIGSGVLTYDGSPIATPARQGEAGLRMLATAPAAQRRGVGRALVEECIARARLAGCTMLALGTMPEMTHAQRLYETMGFVRMPERDKVLPSGRPLLVYGLALSPWPLVRFAEPAEFDAVGELTLAAYAAGGHLNGDEDYALELRDAKRRAAEAELLVAVDRTSGDLMGTVTICPDGSPFREVARPDESEFRMLAVSPTARRRGVGEALTRAVLARAHASGLGGVAMYSGTWMPNAHWLYERLGFVRDSTRDWEPVTGLRLLAFTRDV